MGEVDRYVTTCDCMSKASWGDYVRFSDYDALRAELAELVAALIEAQKIINHQGWSTNEHPAYDAIEAALAKHRGE